MQSLCSRWRSEERIKRFYSTRPFSQITCSFLCALLFFFLSICPMIYIFFSHIWFVYTDSARNLNSLSFQCVAMLEFVTTELVENAPIEFVLSDNGMYRLIRCPDFFPCQIAGICSGDYSPCSTSHRLSFHLTTGFALLS